MKDPDFDNAIHKISEAINKKRREEILTIYNTGEAFKVIAEAKRKGVYDSGNKSKTMRKVACLPVQVDNFFSRVYGPDYWKDKDFFNKIAPEWRVIDSHKI